MLTIEIIEGLETRLGAKFALNEVKLFEIARKQEERLDFPVFTIATFGTLTRRIARFKQTGVLEVAKKQSNEDLSK